MGRAGHPAEHHHRRFFRPGYPVNPHAAELDGIGCLPSAGALPEQVDLAVIAVPARAVLGSSTG